MLFISFIVFQDIKKTLESSFSIQAGEKDKLWVPMKNWISDLQIPWCDALPLSYRDSTVLFLSHLCDKMKKIIFLYFFTN